MSGQHVIEFSDMGCISYDEALLWQQKLSDLRREKKIPDRVLFLEHPPVFTLGKSHTVEDFLLSPESIEKKGIRVFHTDRGGRVTYHGPGQLVGYLIFRWEEAIPLLVRKIEEVLIFFLGDLGLKAVRDQKHPGVWVEDRKIAALGLRVEKGVTRHGFSLNVNCSLSPYRYIHPCGIADKGVTSIQKELGWAPPMKEVKIRLLESIRQVFEAPVYEEGYSAMVLHRNESV